MVAQLGTNKTPAVALYNACAMTPGPLSDLSGWCTSGFQGRRHG